MEKYLYWNWEIGDNILKMPRSYEAGTMVAGMMEAMADAAYQKDPAGLDEFMGTLQEVLGPTGLPVAAARKAAGTMEWGEVGGLASAFLPVLLREGLDQATNWDHFWNQPIVSRSLEQMPAEEQFDKFTSKVGIAIGGMMGIPPKRIDHAIRGIGGAVPMDIIKAAGMGPSGVEREFEVSDIPIFGVFFKKGGVAGRRPKSVADLYDLQDKAYERSKSRKTPETEPERQTRMMLEDATHAVGMLLTARSMATPDDPVLYREWKNRVRRYSQEQDDPSTKQRLQELLDTAEPGKVFASGKEQAELTELARDIARSAISYAEKGTIPTKQAAQAVYGLSQGISKKGRDETVEEYRARRAAQQQEKERQAEFLKSQGLEYSELAQQLRSEYYARNPRSKSASGRKSQQKSIMERLRSLRYWMNKTTAN